ncbi:MAG: PAS domain-containing protein [Caldilineaceae bacterium]
MAIPHAVDPLATPMKRASALRYLLIGIGYVLLFLALDKATQVLETSPGISPWYPPPGLSLALLLTGGLAYLPLLFLAALLSILLSDCCRTAPLLWLSVPLSLTAGYGCAALFLRRFFVMDPRLDRLRDLIRLIVVALLFPLLVGLCVVAVFATVGLLPWPSYANTVLEFWVGDAIGIIVLTPFLLVHLAPHLKKWLEPLPPAKLFAALSKGKALTRANGSTPYVMELLSLVLITLLVLWFTFGLQQTGEWHLFYLCFLPLIWIALRHGLPGATIGILFINVGVVCAVQLFGYVIHEMVSLQLFMLALSLTGLLLGVVVTENRQATEALQQSEAFSHAVLNSLPANIAVLDKEGLIVAVNDAWERFARENGATRVGMEVGENYLAVCQRSIPEAAEAQSVLTGLQAILTGKEHYFSLEYPCHSPVEQRWFTLYATRLALDHGGAVVAHVNITQRKLIEEALRQAEVRTRALLDAMPDMMFRLDHAGIFRDFHVQNDSVLAIPPSRIIGMRLEQTPLPANLIAQTKQATMASLAGGGVQSFEYDFTLPSGVYNFEARVVASGTEEVVAIVRDITARKQAEVKLINERNLLRTLLDILPDYIFIKDTQSRFVVINAAYVHFLGATTAEAVIGKTVLDFYPTKLAEKYIADDRLVLDEHQALPDHEEASVNRAGEQTIHLVTKVPLFTSQGEVVGLVGRGHDITARKQTEAKNVQLLQEIDQQHSHLRALNKRLAEIQENERKALARELHDEVGQNLSLLAINLKILQTQIAPVLATNDAAQMRLKESVLLVQQITERIRNVMADLRPPVLDDYGLLAALEWYAARVVAQTDLAIYVQGQELTPRPNAALEHALFRITQEALTNVVKHAQATQVDITLSVLDGVIRLEIIDNGRGIDVPFWDGATAQQTWGLLNMRERAEAVGGTFRILSGAQQGTSILVEIPSKAANV